jgi:hypothetical protein
MRTPKDLNAFAAVLAAAIAAELRTAQQATPRVVREPATQYVATKTKPATRKAGTKRSAAKPKAAKPNEFVNWLHATAEQRKQRQTDNKALAAQLRAAGIVDFKADVTTPEGTMSGVAGGQARSSGHVVRQGR